MADYGETNRKCLRRLVLVVVVGLVLAFFILSNPQGQSLPLAPEAKNRIASDHPHNNLQTVTLEGKSNEMGVFNQPYNWYKEKDAVGSEAIADTTIGESRKLNGHISDVKKKNIKTERKMPVGSNEIKKVHEFRPDTRVDNKEESSSTTSSTTSSMTSSTTDFTSTEAFSSTSLASTESPKASKASWKSSKAKISISNIHSGVEDFRKTMEMSERFAARRIKIRDTCKRHKEFRTNVKNRMKRKYANGRLSWCMIPKVGTTFLGYLQKTVFKPNHKNDMNLSLPRKLRNSFFLVREPYERLISGYVCKIVLTASWWKMYGRNIVKEIRSKSHNSESCGNDVTFLEFVKYFINSQETKRHRNTHFIPIHEQCNICQSHFNFVGHLETFKDDFNFILQSVNVSVDFSLNHEERELKGKASGVFKYKDAREKCEPICKTLRKAWWSFHVRGLISKGINFPLDDNTCSTISPEEFANVAWDAHERSVGSMDKRKQKRDAVVELYLQIPLKYRLKLKEIFQIDFEMFGYEPMPADIFPELKRDT